MPGDVASQHIGQGNIHEHNGNDGADDYKDGSGKEGNDKADSSKGSKDDDGSACRASGDEGGGRNA